MQNKKIILGCTLIPLIILCIICSYVLIFIVAPIVENFTIERNIIENSEKIDHCYMKYDNHIYQYTIAEFYYKFQIDADPATFTSVDKDFCIGKDDKAVYFGTHKRIEFDAKKFRRYATNEIIWKGQYSPAICGDGKIFVSCDMGHDITNNVELKH